MSVSEAITNCISKKWKIVLTVSGLGSRILRMNDFALAENQNGQTYSAALIYKLKKRKFNNKLTAG